MWVEVSGGPKGVAQTALSLRPSQICSTCAQGEPPNRQITGGGNWVALSE